MRNPEDVVYIPDEDVFGFIVGGMGAYYTNIRYIKAGMEFEVLMENDEFEFMEEEIDHDD